MEQENENPLYETTGGDEALNPIYDRFVCLFITFPELIGISFSIAKLAIQKEKCSTKLKLHSDTVCSILPI